MSNPLIIAYGNPLRGDDGLGWRVAEALRAARPDLQILTLQQLTPELMDPISRSGRVVFIDACEGTVPGEVRESVVQPQSAGAAFTHHATPAALLAGAQALYGRAPAANLITVTGADFSFSDQLSPLVSAQVEAVLRMALRLLG